MKRPTFKSIKEAAKKSKRAAIKSGLDKYMYLMSLTEDEVRKLTSKFLGMEGCAVCLRYSGASYPCPLRDKKCIGGCISDWTQLNAQHSLLEETDCDYYYQRFIFYAVQIYVKLLKLLEE